jgi:hypothetical protein
MSTRTVALSSMELDSAIEVLSSAKTLQPTRFQRLSYRALIISVDVAAICYLVYWVNDAFNHYDPDKPDLRPIVVVPVLLAFMAILVGLVALALNIPLFLRALHERTRLKELGLTSLTKSLWKESRRNRWISRIRGAVLMTVAGLFAITNIIIAMSAFVVRADVSMVITQLIGLIIGVTLFAGTRFLQIQRERMDLTTNAEELRKAFQRLRQRAGKTDVVSVPTELVEQTAKIEAAQIAKERKEAILESVSSRPTGYAIAFDRDAIEQRTRLDVADRIELADLVAQLSIAGMQLEQREGMQRDKTKSNRVEIDYVIDNASHSIRVIAVRRVMEGSRAFVSGGSHA